MGIGTADSVLEVLDGSRCANRVLSAPSKLSTPLENWTVSAVKSEHSTMGE
jgi:hypothetical protein